MPGPAPGGPTDKSYYVSPTGTIQRQTNPLLAAGLNATSWSGPYTQAAAKAEANNVAARISAGAITAAVPGISPGVANAPDKAVANSLDWGKALSNFLGDLTQVGTYVRIAKILIVGVLIIVGISKMTGFDNAVAKTATTAAKAAVL
jgi:hypothetical protein